MDLDLSRDFEDYWPPSTSGSTVEVRNTFLHVGKNESELTSSKIWASDFVCNYRELEAITGGQTTKSRRRRPGKKARTRMARRNSNAGQIDLSESSHAVSETDACHDTESAPCSGTELNDVPQSVASPHQPVSRVGAEVGAMSPAYIRPSSALSSEPPHPRAQRKPRRSVSFGDISPHCIAAVKNFGMDMEHQNSEDRPISNVTRLRRASHSVQEHKAIHSTEEQKANFVVNRIPQHKRPDEEKVITNNVPEQKVTERSQCHNEVVEVATVKDKSRVILPAVPQRSQCQNQATEVAPMPDTSKVPVPVVSERGIKAENLLSALISPNVTGALLVLTTVMLLWVAGVIEIRVGSQVARDPAANTVNHLREEMELRMAFQEQRLKDLVAELYTAQQTTSAPPQQVDGVSRASNRESPANDVARESIDRSPAQVESSKGSGGWDAKSISLMWLTLVVACLAAQLFLKQRVKDS